MIPYSVEGNATYIYMLVTSFFLAIHALAFSLRTNSSLVGLLGTPYLMVKYVLLKELFNPFQFNNGIDGLYTFLILNGARCRSQTLVAKIFNGTLNPAYKMLSNNRANAAGETQYAPL